MYELRKLAPFGSNPILIQTLLDNFAEVARYADIDRRPLNWKSFIVRSSHTALSTNAPRSAPRA